MPRPASKAVIEMFHAACTEELRRLTGSGNPSSLARLSPEEIQMVAERAVVSCPAPTGVPDEAKIAWMVEADRLACIALSRQDLPPGAAGPGSLQLSARPDWIQALVSAGGQTAALQAGPLESTGKPASGSHSAVEQLTLF